MPSYEGPLHRAGHRGVRANLSSCQLIVVDSSTDEERRECSSASPTTSGPPRGTGGFRRRTPASRRGNTSRSWMRTTRGTGKLETGPASRAQSSVGLVCSDVVFDEQGPSGGRCGASPRQHGAPGPLHQQLLGTLTVVAQRGCLTRGMFDETITASESRCGCSAASGRSISWTNRWRIRYSPDQASADRPRTLYGMSGRPDSGLIRVQGRAYAGSPEAARPRSPRDRGFSSLPELAGLWGAEGKRAEARAMLARHRRARADAAGPQAVGQSWLP